MKAANYRVVSHLGVVYTGTSLEDAHLHADSVIEGEECFGYKTWPHYESICRPRMYIREQVCSEDIYRFISIVEEE
jgi:hypothetical protein